MSSKDPSVNHLRLTQVALKCRAEAEELRLAAWAAQRNAEAIEKIVCEGTDSQVSEALHAHDWARKNERLS